MKVGIIDSLCATPLEFFKTLPTNTVLPVSSNIVTCLFMRVSSKSFMT